MASHDEPLKLDTISKIDHKRNTTAHRRIVTSCCEGGSIEIVWETTDSGTQRIALYPGPDSNEQEKVRLTLMLPPETIVPNHDDKSAMVLSNVLEQQVLCCLINPNSVLLLDIFPHKETPALIPPEGWTVPLPFQCQGIFALHNQGLLLHRKEDVEHMGPPTWKSQFHTQLPAPPFSGPQPLLPNSSGSGLSLFSFHHPLQEILPVAVKNFDVQHVIWVEKDLMVARGKQNHYAIYQIADSPPPVRPPPLYQAIKDRYDTTPQESDAKLLLLETTLDVELPPPPGQQKLPVSRDAALADALGVTPQNSKKPPHHHRPSYSPPVSDTVIADVTHHSAMVGNSQASLRPRVVVSLLYEERDKQQDVTNVFAVKGLAQERLLVIQCSSFLKLYTIEAIKVVPLAKIPSISAQPITSIGSAVDLLVVDPQNRLCLYRGNHFITSCSIPAVHSPITEVTDGVGSRCTAHCLGSRWRVILKLTTTSDEQLMTALEAVFSVTLSLAIRLLLCRGATARSVILKLVRQLLGISRELPTPPPYPTSNAWEQLLQSEYHEQFERIRYGASSGWESTDLKRNAATFDVEGTNFATLFDVLHLLYEERKMSGDEQKLFETMEILVTCCAMYKSVSPHNRLTQTFLDFYKMQVGETMVSKIVSSSPVLRESAITVKLSTYAAPPSLVEWMKSTLQGADTQNPYNQIESQHLNDAFRKTRVILRIFRTRNQEEIILGLVEEGFRCPTDFVQAFPPCVTLPLLGILSEYMMKSSSLVGSREWPADAWRLVGRTDLAANVEPPAIQNGQADSTADDIDDDDDDEEDEDADGLKELEKDSVMLFPSDNRVREAIALLRSSQPISLRVDRPIEVTDHDYERLKQKGLLLMFCRSLALPVGRGMLTLGTVAYPKVTCKIPIPEISMKGKVSPSNANITLDMNECPTDLLVWPYFHNGVAAGLRLPSTTDPGSDFRATRTWIRFNRPNQAQPRDTEADGAARLLKSHAHAGFLLGLGLRGNLASLEMSDLYEYLTEGSITTTVGMVLGIAANKRGSCDIAVSKMISLHIPSLIPQHFSAIDVASPVQAAAVTASGILFQSSSHRMMTEFLLNEIGKRPDTDVSTVDREAYSLACGLALGTVNLCHGEVNGISDRAAGLTDLRIEERLIRYIVGGVDPDEERRKQESNDRFSLRTGGAGDSERCSTVYEGPEINSIMCAPGSILALGLMYMKTENQSIAASLSLPETHFLLEFVRPDFLGLLVIARSLILWNDVSPDEQWIEGQVPSAITEARNHIRSTTLTAAYGEAEDPHVDRDYDQTAVRRMYVHIIAGACFGMGLRYAGTANERAKETIMKKIFELHGLREVSDPVSTALRPEIPILDSCIGTAAISLSMVMAGTGDLSVLRLLRMLRWRCEADSRYGIHMIFGMSIGLLFLGGCTCTLGRDPEDIAALVTAFFPVLPASTSENHYHLQAIRHLYVLAVKKRLLRAIDVDTGLNVQVPIEIRAESHRLSLQAPSLLPFCEEPWKELVLVSEKYYPLSINLRTFPDSFYVKKRHRSLEHGQNQASIKELVEAVTESNLMKSFAEYVVGKEALTSPNARALVEALSVTEETLLLYLKLVYAPDRYRAWNLQVIRANTQGTLFDSKLPAMIPALQDQMDRRIEEVSQIDPESAELLFSDCYGQYK